MDMKEIVMRLIGPVQPVGDHNVDQDRLKNLQELTFLTDLLLGEIHKASMNADRHEASMKAIGKHAEEFLANVHDNY